MSEDIHNRRRKLELQCRSRSCLEADLLFARLRSKVFGFSVGQLDELEGLLAMDDRDLLRLVTHRPGEAATENSVFRLLLQPNAE